MEFRWVAFIALWTCLVGPIVGAPSKSAASVRKPPAAASKANVKPAISSHARH
jgi:hypothetical protein